MRSPTFKRILDIALAIPALIVASPIIFVAAILVKLDSRGPALYWGWREGREGRPFRICKLRTMTTDGDRGGPHLTLAADTRVTRIGRMLRRSKIDELPQLLNVLRGEMSLVGPRPEHPDYVRLYTPEQRRVLDVRPGMTSLAALTYADEEEVLAGADAEKTYVEVVMPKKLALDQEYVAHQSLARDFVILLRTAQLVLARTFGSEPSQTNGDSVGALPEGRLFRYAIVMLGFTAACLPLYVVRWHYGPISTTLLEGLVLATIALYILARWRAGSLHLQRTPYDLPILGLLMAGAIAVVVPPDRWHALGLYRAYFVEPIAIFYVAIDLLRRPGQVRTLLLGLGIGSSTFAVMNIVAFVVAVLEKNVAPGAAPTALYTSANEVAMYLEPPAALATGLVLFADRCRDRGLALAWLAFLSPALALTLSRGAYLALGVLAVVAVVSVRRRLLLLAPTMAAVVVGAIVLYQVPFVANRLTEGQATVIGRLSIFAGTISILRAHPILGTGLGGYPFLYRGAIPEIYPHDLWLSFWVEVGVLGLVAFGAIFLGLLYRGWRAFSRAEGFNRAVLWGVLGGLVLWGVHGLVDTPYWKNDMSIEFWILAGLEVASIRGLADRRRAFPAA